MPKAVERALKRRAAEKGLTGKRADAFVYGTMRHQLGWKPEQERRGHPTRKATGGKVKDSGPRFKW